MTHLNNCWACGGVVSLNVDCREAPFMEANGNLHLEQSHAVMSDGKEVDMTDADLAVAASDVADVEATVASDDGWLFA